MSETFNENKDTAIHNNLEMGNISEQLASRTTVSVLTDFVTRKLKDSKLTFVRMKSELELMIKDKKLFIYNFFGLGFAKDKF